MRPWAVVLTGSLLLGSMLGAVAPATWSFRWTDGLLLGSALYVAAFRRYVDRREAEGAIELDAGRGALAGLVLSMLPGLLLRTALFVGLLSLQATVCFDLIPDADVRRGFVVLSAWVVMLALIDTGPARGSAQGPARGSAQGPAAAGAHATSASRPPSR